MTGRHRAARLLAMLLFPMALVACGGPAPSATSAAPEGPIVGVVVAVDSAGLGQVRAFTLRTADGTTLEIAVGPLENATSFPPGHLAEHQLSSEPVRVYYRVEAGRPVAYRIEDAGS